MKTVEVVAAIIKHNNKIFATQRGYGEFKDGWEFPGGKIESSETPQQALVREIEEKLDTIDLIKLSITNRRYLTGHSASCKNETPRIAYLHCYWGFSM